MNNFEMPKIEIVKFACDSEAITTSTNDYVFDNASYTDNITHVNLPQNMGGFLDYLTEL